MERFENEFGNDYQSENPELQENLQNEIQETEYEYNTYDIPMQDTTEASGENEAESANKKPADKSAQLNMWKNVAKIALIVLFFIALFFASMWITTLVLDRNHRVDDFDDNKAPEYSENKEENEEEFGIIIDTDDVSESVTVVEDDEAEKPAKKPSSGNKKPAASTSSGNKKDESSKPAESDKTETSAESDSNTPDSDTSTAEPPAQGNTATDTKPEPSAPAPEQSAPSTAPVPQAPTLVPSIPAE